MKSKRHAKILEIISQQKIETQEALLNELHRHGYDVTQATVSRDIKELSLVKIKGTEGRYYYSHVAEQQPGSTMDRLLRLLRNSIVSIDHVRNMIVIKTLTGTANAAAEAIDSLKDDTVLGSLAGDNTILVIMREDEDSPIFVNKIKQFI